MAKKINGKQILDNTIVKSINGITYSYQGLSSSNDSNVTLSLISSGFTHSFGIGWTGILPINRGGLSNSTFTASQILIMNSATSSIISSGYKFNDELKGDEQYPLGTVAMANSGPNTNGSQFFIVTANPGAPLPPNYTVFGKVTKGIETALAIQNVKTGQADRPVDDVIIERVELR